MRARRTLLFLAWTALSMSGCEDASPDVAEGPAAVEEPAIDSVVVDLVPGQDRYVLAKLDIGTLAISLETIRPSGAGSDIVLQIGNTSAAGLENLSATIQWGVLAADGTPQTAPERTREAPISENVQPGKWTRAVITLADVPPAELGFIRLSNIDFTGLILK